ncbi:MAG TPA: hypothetical protein PLK94_07110 [Alphaproteobacteria bacterium]|nr:hypothetical protein [Alphaproteobacteria bacterium]HOO51038.1 hypothetical protein [Alphaproteobacteria bacterium]
MILLKRIIMSSLALAILGIVAMIVLVLLEINHWHSNYIVAVKEHIPTKIKIDKILADDYEEALPGGWCHGLAFKISNSSLLEINRQGLDFFKDISPSDAVKTKGSESYWTEWKEKTNYFTDDGAQIPSGCLTEFEKFRKKNGYVLRRDTKVYYTYVKHRGYSNISVYPEWGIVVYGSWAN